MIRLKDLKFAGMALCLALLPLSACADPAPDWEVWADGLDQPWGLAFLSGKNEALVTEKKGSLRAISADGQLSDPIVGVPDVYYAGQGGLFDVLPHPEFSANRLVYLSYAEGSPKDNGTAIARGRLEGNQLVDVEVIFRNYTRKDTPVHYGGRMAFLADGTLLLTSGDGFNYREAAQDIASGLGKVFRMNDDGSPASGNPFPEAPYVWTLGHRNPQGLAVDDAGKVWLHEHGPRGGDELNLLEAGKNYGWPVVTFGVDYSGATISPLTEMDGMVSPVRQWTPSIAPSGLAANKGDLYLGALVDRDVRRLEMHGVEAGKESRLLESLDARIRDVRLGPDGMLYILTPGQVLKMEPVQ